MKFGANPSEGGESNYLKLKDGESATGIFRGDPLEFYVKWENKKSVVVEPTDPAGKFRFRINFVIKDATGNYKALLWDQGTAVYNKLKSLNEEFPLESTIVKVTRKGVELNTEYDIMPTRNNQVSPETEEILKTLKLNDLAHKAEASGPVPTNIDNDEIPF